MKFLIDTFANRYPESFGLGLVVDAPFIFWACWKLISPLMDPGILFSLTLLIS